MSEEESTKEKTPDEILGECMGKYSSVVVTGIDENGSLFMRTSVASVPVMHWMMNRSIFELGLWEKTASNVDSDVDQKAPKE